MHNVFPNAVDCELYTIFSEAAVSESKLNNEAYFCLSLPILVTPGHHHQSCIHGWEICLKSINSIKYFKIILIYCGYS